MMLGSVSNDPAEQAADGKAAGRERPRSSHAELSIGSRDPLAILRRQDESRAAELVPLIQAERS